MRGDEWFDSLARGLGSEAHLQKTIDARRSALALVTTHLNNGGDPDFRAFLREQPSVLEEVAGEPEKLVLVVFHLTMLAEHLLRTVCGGNENAARAWLQAVALSTE